MYRNINHFLLLFEYIILKDYSFSNMLLYLKSTLKLIFIQVLLILLLLGIFILSLVVFSLGNSRHILIITKIALFSLDFISLV